MDENIKDARQNSEQNRLVQTFILRLRPCRRPPPLDLVLPVLWMGDLFWSFFDHFFMVLGAGATLGSQWGLVGCQWWILGGFLGPRWVLIGRQIHSI